MNLWDDPMPPWVRIIALVAIAVIFYRQRRTADRLRRQVTDLRRSLHQAETRAWEAEYAHATLLGEGSQERQAAVGWPVPVETVEPKHGDVRPCRACGEPCSFVFDPGFEASFWVHLEIPSDGHRADGVMG